MEQLQRSVPLPDEMQGHWVDADDPSSALVIEGGEVSCFGKVVEYDFKLQGSEDGATIVSLQIEDQSKIDDFQGANITDLVITPEGEFHAYNMSFSCMFVRDEEQG